jgi:hypothetical protein
MRSGTDWLASFAVALLACSTCLGESDTPARALPQRVVICIDRAAPRCWTAASEEQCRASEGAEVFRALARGDGSVSHGSALTECWQSVKEREAR